MRLLECKARGQSQSLTNPIFYVQILVRNLKYDILPFLSFNCVEEGMLNPFKSTYLAFYFVHKCHEFQYIQSTEFDEGK